MLEKKRADKQRRLDETKESGSGKSMGNFSGALEQCGTLTICYYSEGVCFWLKGSAQSKVWEVTETSNGSE